MYAKMTLLVLTFALIMVAVGIAQDEGLDAPIGLPISMRLSGELRPALEGELFEGTLEFTVHDSGQVTNFNVTGDDWTGIAFTAPDTIDLHPGDTLFIPFSGTPGASSQFLCLDYSFVPLAQPGQDHYFHSSECLDLSAWRYQYRTYGAELVSLSGTKPLSAQDGSKDRGFRGSLTLTGRCVYERWDNVQVGLDGGLVKVYEYDWSSGTFTKIGEEYTDFDGNFGMVVLLSASDDIRVEVELDHPAVDIPGWTGWTMAFNITEPSHDLQELLFADEDLHATWLTHTNIVRAWRWFVDYMGITIPKVSVDWPAASSFHRGSTNTIYLTEYAGWSYSTIWHEYGHHFMDEEADYVNGGYGDPCGGTDGHVAWCSENDKTAWCEGTAIYISDLMSRKIEDAVADLGLPALYPYTKCDYETIQLCNDPTDCPSYGLLENPWITEGHIAAVLRDIEDGYPAAVISAENDASYPGSADVMAKDPANVLQVMMDYKPILISEFFENYLTEFPSHAEQLCETAANCGFYLDVDAPSLPTTFTSSHTAWATDNTDYTIDFEWTDAEDDCSGIMGYYCQFDESDATDPSVSGQLTQALHVTAALPDYDTWYYFNVRTVDYAGNLSATWASLGPYKAIIPSGKDYSYATSPPAGWRQVLVPRATPDAAAGVVQYSDALLPGQTYYWNTIGENAGTLDLNSDFNLRFYRDGQEDELYVFSSPGTPPGSNYWAINHASNHLGRGGRHTLHVKHDYGEAYSELDESNNHWGKQYVWQGRELELNVELSSAAPPVREAGWQHCVDTDLDYNCRGFRIETTDSWSAVIMRLMDARDDYDMRLHDVSTSCVDGFDDVLVASEKGPGKLDAIFINGNSGLTEDFYDIGVIEMITWQSFLIGQSPVWANFRTKHIPSTTVSPSVPWNATMGAQDRMVLGDVVLTDIPYVIEVSVTPPGSEEIHVFLTEGWPPLTSLSEDPLAEGTVDPTTGTVTLDVDLSTGGTHHALAAYRNPDGAKGPGASKSDPLDVQFLVRPATGDIAPAYRQGWYSPLVPRASADGTPQSVPLPDYLIGDEDSTWINFAGMNGGPVDETGYLTRVYVDGQELWTATVDTAISQGSHAVNGDTALTVPGGRHTLTAQYDADNEIDEIYEDNNYYSEQYVWSPVQMEPFMPVYRGAPGHPMAGWTGLRDDQIAWFNRDGLRTPVFLPTKDSSYWGVVALMPTDTALDIDLSLHEVVGGVKDGFSTGIQFSGWGPGQSDFALVNFRKTTFRGFHAAAIQSSSVTADYVAMVDKSDQVDWVIGSVYDYPMPEEDFVNIHELYFEPGSYQIDLFNDSGNVDWGMALHPGNMPYISKSTALQDGIVWVNGPGVGETMNINVGDPVYLCLSVWKVGADDLGQAGVYSFSISDDGCCDLRGDINHDGTGPDISDLVFLVTFMFQGGSEPPCETPAGSGYYAEADMNGDSTGPDISDLVHLVTYMFQNGPPPVPCP